MAYLRFFVFVVSILCYSNGFSQHFENFWKETSSFPTLNNGSGNTAIAIDPVLGHLLIGTVTEGIFLSEDEGNSWSQVLKPSTKTSINKILYAADGLVYAAGDHMIFRSENAGISWIEIPFNSYFPITDLYFHKDGSVFASTGGSIEVNGHGEFNGDGIFKSTDSGKTWETVNNGLSSGLAVFQLAGDSKGRIFATVNDSYGSGAGGIYYSDDLGQWWHKFSKLNFMDSQERTSVNLIEALMLEVDKNDSIYIGYTGTTPPGSSGSSVALSGNLKNTFEGGVTGQPWKQEIVRPSQYSWFYQPMFSMFWDLNGNKYSSLYTVNSTSIGGPYFSEYFSNTWSRQPSGILPVNSSYLACYFDKTEEGKVFAIHLYDHRVYFNGRNIVTERGNSSNNSFSISPNPATGVLNVLLPIGLEKGTIEIYSANGTKIKSLGIDETFKSINIDELHNGIYFVKLYKKERTFTEKLVIDK